MNCNFDFKDITEETDFVGLKNALKENFDKLLKKGYLYKGDMGETPQIVNRPLGEVVKEEDEDGNIVNTYIKWSALGKSIIGEIFKDTKNKKYKKHYDEYGNVTNIDALIKELTDDGKLNGFNRINGRNGETSSATYPWWCADGDSGYPIYPATYFVYIDSTPNDIRNDGRWKEGEGDGWKDDSCVLIPADVEYSDYGATAEEKEPMITYHKNHIYPTFYFDSEVASAGAWCWEINGVKTGVPASVANDDGSVLGHMFIFKNEGGIYYYKAGVNPNEDEDWMTMEEMKKANLRYPIKGDIGFTIKEVEEKDEGTGEGSTPTVTNINTLQIYNFVEDDNDEANANGGAWGLGGNLISFGESFYKALWEFISGDSGVEINKGKITLSTSNGKHCIFVKKDNDPTLVLMPLQLTVDPTSKKEFEDADIWKNTELQLNYPKTTIDGEVNIKNRLNVSNNIVSSSINTGNIASRNIINTGSISGKSVSCAEITANNNFAVNDTNIIIGSKNTNIDLISPNFRIRDNLNIFTKLPFYSSNDIKISSESYKYVKIYADKSIDTVRNDLSSTLTETKHETREIISGGKDIRSYVKKNYPLDSSGSGVTSCDVVVNYKSDTYDLPKDMVDIKLSMPYSLGISINIYGKNNSGSWPVLTSGSIILKLIAKTGTGEEVLYNSGEKLIEGNSNESIFDLNKLNNNLCTIYCSISSKDLDSVSSKLRNNVGKYNYIYITADATFKLGVGRSPIGIYHEAIYEAGTNCYVYSCPFDTLGGSMWTSGGGSFANSLTNIFTITATTESPITGSKDISTVGICQDGILIGKSKNNSATLYIDDDGFHIKYYGLNTEKNILSITPLGICSSNVFQLKTS